MATTFRGTAVSYPIYGNDLLTQNLFTIENAKSSRVNLIIKRLTIQNDSLSNLTSVMPIVKTSRTSTTITGGINLAKVPFDTSQASSNGVTIRAAIASSSIIIVTEGNTGWEQYTYRNHSAAEQRIAEDYNLLPKLIEGTNDKFILIPGQSLLVQVRGAVVASNPAISNNWFVQVVWEEDSLGTFAISGTVTLSSVPVEGARILVLEGSDTLMTDAVLIEVVTTNALGQWSSTIKSGRIGAAFVQHKDGGTYYTAPGSPFLEQ